MGVRTIAGWDNHHTSSRSEDEVIRLVREIPNITLAYDHSGGSVGTAITMDFDIEITKGIHDDSRGKHITIRVGGLGGGRTYHLYLTKTNWRGSSFVWQVSEIR